MTTESKEPNLGQQWILAESDIEWEMHWQQNLHKDKPPTEMIFEPEKALACLLMNEVVFINSNWWKKELPEKEQKSICVAVNCGDTFAYACADAEELPHDEIESLYRAWRSGEYGVTRWCCLQRKQRPLKEIENWMRNSGAWDEAMEALPQNTDNAYVQGVFARYAEQTKIPPA